MRNVGCADAALFYAKNILMLTNTDIRVDD